MHVLVTGYQNKNKIQGHGFADIRIVAIQDPNDDPNVESGNTDALITSINNLIKARCGDVLEEYHINQNNISQETKNSKLPSALRISVPDDMVQGFLDDNFWQDPIGRLLKNKCYKTPDGNKFYVNIPFSFDKNDVMTHINNSAATGEDYKNAMNLTTDFIHKMFQNLESPQVQGFLKNFCGSIQFAMSNGDGNGWEYVQLSQKNSLMVLAQYASKGIIPQFVCNARDWSLYFNRKLKPNAIGAVIEVPVKNKRRDDSRYSQVTNGRNLSSDMQQGGSLGYMAQWVGFNQHDLETNMFPGWVFDESQTELMTDSQGKPLPDILNDPSQQRRKTNVGNDITLAYGDTVVAQQSKNNIEQGIQSPFEDNTSKIPECLENIKQTINLKRYFNKQGRNKYEMAMPFIDAALRKPTVNAMIQVVQALAKCDLFQIENRNNKKDAMVKIITSVVMANCGFGDVSQMAAYARQMIQSKEEALKLSDVISNIAIMINGTMIGKMNENKLNEELCKTTSFEELVHDLGLENVVNNNSIQTKEPQQTLKEVRENFFKTLDRINNAEL